jgi:hypothetical protein
MIHILYINISKGTVRMLRRNASMNVRGNQDTQINNVCGGWHAGEWSSRQCRVPVTYDSHRYLGYIQKS